jgi:hypothetical protein
VLVKAEDANGNIFELSYFHKNLDGLKGAMEEVCDCAVTKKEVNGKTYYNLDRFDVVAPVAEPKRSLYQDERQPIQRGCGGYRTVRFLITIPDANFDDGDVDHLDACQIFEMDLQEMGYVKSEVEPAPCELPHETELDS